MTVTRVRPMRQLLITCVAVLTASLCTIASQPAIPPGAAPALKFAAIGDNGTGQPPQYDVARQMETSRARFPFELVIMLGDNLYGRQEADDFVLKFERPYAPMLQAGIPFFAALGNHDNPANRNYTRFNMGGERYYTFARGGVRFFVLDTNLLDKPQLAWLDAAMPQAQEPWKIAMFHHPLYSDGGRHGSNVELRVVLEPYLIRHGVDVVFAGHEHIYERLKPQNGITYFVEGASGQLRKGDVAPSSMTAAAFADDQTFMLVEITGDTMHFQAISRTGRVVDAGTITCRPTT